jgi:hypothetical protein
MGGARRMPSSPDREGTTSRLARTGRHVRTTTPRTRTKSRAAGRKPRIARPARPGRTPGRAARWHRPNRKGTSLPRAYVTTQRSDWKQQLPPRTTRSHSTEPASGANREPCRGPRAEANEQPSARTQNRRRLTDRRSAACTNLAQRLSPSHTLRFYHAPYRHSGSTAAATAC